MGERPKDSSLIGEILTVRWLNNKSFSPIPAVESPETSSSPYQLEIADLPPLSKISFMHRMYLWFPTLNTATWNCTKPSISPVPSPIRHPRLLLLLLFRSSHKHHPSNRLASFSIFNSFSLLWLPWFPHKLFSFLNFHRKIWWLFIFVIVSHKHKCLDFIYLFSVRIALNVPL